MATIFLTESQFKKLTGLVNEEEIHFSDFMSHIKGYLKTLMSDPVYAKPDEFLCVHGLDSSCINKKLSDADIIVKKEQIKTSDGADKFSISYKIPAENFEKKVRVLCNSLTEARLNEDGEGSVVGGSVGGDGGTNGATNASSSGQYVVPLGQQIIKRKIGNNIQEDTESGMFGSFSYDAPPFVKKKDPAYDHSNMMRKSIPRRKKKTKRHARR